MFYCNYCKSEFYEPAVFSERLEHFGMPCSYVTQECPFCGSSDFCRQD